jgi:dihydrofolate reductase
MSGGPRLSLIAAMAENRVIGADNRLPWHLPEDLKHFRKLTSGHPVILGRKTYESIGRLLPNRTNVIVTRNPAYRVEGAVIVGSLDEAIAAATRAPGGDEVFVIGGAEIYALALPRADRIYLTEVHQHVEGDAYFPELPAGAFVVETRDDRGGNPSFSFLKLARRADGLGSEQKP